MVGLDIFATGHQRNLDQVQILVSPAQWENFNFIQGDIRNLDDCRTSMIFTPSLHGDPSLRAQRGNPSPVDYVLHHAALGSVPRSIEDPITTNQNNIEGSLNMLVAARDAQVKSFTYAASSSTYGVHPGLPKVEHIIGDPLSPYAVNKYVNELYAQVFALRYRFNTVRLRYFNVFGGRQDPNGAYAAVIPKWIAAMLNNQDVFINGDGETTRVFCYVANTVQANLLAATTSSADAINQVYNVAAGERISLDQLFNAIVNVLAESGIKDSKRPVYLNFRDGDVRHSLAEINKAISLLGYQCSHRVAVGLNEAIRWYLDTEVGSAKST